MFKTDITYKNFLGNDVTETFRFNLSETECLDLASENAMFNTDILSYIATEQNLPAMIKIVRELVVKAYGIMSEDGKYFRKRPEDVYDFEHSAAYDALIDKLISTDDVNYLSEFLIGIFPAKFAPEIRKRVKESDALNNANGLAVIDSSK